MFLIGHPSCLTKSVGADHCLRGFQELCRSGAMRPFISLVLIGLTFPLASCAAGTASGGSRGSSSVITTEELEAARVDTRDLFDLIERLRPNWLVSRGSTMRERIDPVVYVDGTRFGELESLRDIAIIAVLEVRWISARDATFQYGTGHAGGIIAVSTAR